MSVKQNAALTGLIVVLIFVSGCGQRLVMDEPGPGKKHGQEDKRSFRIYIYHPDPHQPDCLVDWPQAILWKTKQQTARWISDDDAKYTVDFGLGHNGSPFGGGTFLVPAHGDSGDLAPTSQPGYYDYGIRDANGNTCKNSSNPDPGVYVK